ncbi:response regulator [Massilia violaceinigra]|uniref:Response regulator n=1 Tax=Massilia violaceinigra TaxID=2045208 RepID=A0ABY4AE90_9BURK|nr:response regulator [Massilia violaceinigra]UOD33130.1 response regulator [Massilia violaceinigra]
MDSDASHGLKSILYVEDDLHVRTTAKLVLEVIGKFEVRDCGSGREALLAAMDFKPDLILLDVMMPDLDGLATLAMLRRIPHLAGTPALFVTGLTAEADIARYAEVGAIGVIPKPLMPLRLTGQLHSLWERHALAAC